MTDTIRAILRQSLMLFLIGGFGSAVLFGSFLGVDDVSSFFREVIFQGMTWVLLWVGNGVLSEYLDRKFDWLKQTEWRFGLGILTMMVYTIVSISALVSVRLMVVNGLSLRRVISVYNPSFFWSALLITVLISLFLHGRAFLKEWRNSASEAERLRNETLKARFEILKSQVNPHFLFNSFNVLSTLVYKDADKAAKFIQEMSNLYRYVLDTQEKETVRIDEELRALQSFIYLSKMRFGDSLEIVVDLEKIKDKEIAPMVLQMLLENAIKHNIVSKSKPLKIKILTEDNLIIVENNLQRKNNVSASTGIGLSNIQARYGYLSNRKLTISEFNDLFSVKIPVLEYRA
jgi:LytS/YehU family sensor histidine kinase